MTRRVVVAWSLVVFATMAVVLGQTSDPHVGTWKLNAAKSKYTPGTGLKSGTAKIEAAGSGVKIVVDGVQVDGKAMHYEYTANYDGKDVRINGETPNGDTVALTRVDANTLRTAYKKAGKPTTTQTAVVSADGKTRTITTKGTNAIGQTVDSTAVWDKQ